MHCHPNARRTPRGRAEVFELVEAGMTVTAACIAARVSRRFYYRWLPAWRAAGEAGLVDRSCRPHSSPRRLSVAQEAHIGGLRVSLGWGPDRIAVLVGLPASTVHRVLRRLGLLERHREPVAIVRYEHAEAGGLLHVDTKKLGRIVGGPGHRATGDRRGQKAGVGWDVLHVALDDATRLVYAELLPNERGRTAARFLVRALRWFRSQGVVVRRLLTDNGAAYRSRVFRRTVRRAIGRHTYTRPYRPQTNGKVERWIRTVLTESLYVEAFASSAEREVALARFVGYYNDVRPHLGLGGQTPRQRLAVKLAA
jgi:transposase InsO family protein